MSGSPPEPPDTELVAAGRDGDRDALETLLRRHQPRLYAVCHRLTGTATEAEDACQEALIAIVRGLPSFDGRSAFSTWAYRVTTNTCLDELRRHRRRPEPRETTDSVDSSDRRDVADRVAVQVDVDAALATLPIEFRAAVVLRDLCDLSYDEIASTLGIPPGTVRSRIARGRSALLPLLAGTATGNNEPPAGRQSL